MIVRATVTDIDDPKGKGRIKAKLIWDGYVSLGMALFYVSW
jgi:hypothetical protein